MPLILFSSIYRYVTPNSTEITYIIETGFTYLSNKLAKVEVTIKDKT